MDRIDHQRALFLGLCALQDYADRARRDPLDATIHLRALLALLAVHGETSSAYSAFWKIVRTPLDPNNPYRRPQDYERGTVAQTHWTNIARSLGFPAVHTEFCTRIQDVLRQAREAKSVHATMRKPDCGWL